MISELSVEIHERIETLCKEGDGLTNEGLYLEARAKYIKALKLLPDPPFNWKASTWIYAAIGDTHFYSGNFEKMMKCFFNKEY